MEKPKKRKVYDKSNQTKWGEKYKRLDERLCYAYNQAIEEYEEFLPDEDDLFFFLKKNARIDISISNGMLGKSQIFNDEQYRMLAKIILKRLGGKE